MPEQHIPSVIRHRRSILLNPELWVLAAILAALTQISWAGYQFGVGNQAIQVPFLQRLADPAMFAQDAMVTQTLDRYPSLLFTALAPLLHWFSVPTLYATLHILAGCAAMLAVLWLSLRMFRRPQAGVVAMLLLLSGLQPVLAGDTMYSAGFTHTWLSYAWGLVALAMVFQGWLLAAAVVLGLLVNVHALEAGYLSIMVGFWATASWRQVGLRRLAWCAILWLVAASPGIWMLTRQTSGFDSLWLTLTRLRSSDHSFPSSWWRPGATEIPRLAVLLGLAVVAWSYPFRARARRMIALMAVAVMLLFVIGYLGTEVWPQPLIVRAQLFRASRFLVTLAILVIAHGCYQGARLPWRTASLLAPWRRWAEAILALVIGLTVALPSLAVLLPTVLVVAVLLAWINRRLSWVQAGLSGVAILICILAWRTTDFILPDLRQITSGALNLKHLLPDRLPTLPGWLSLAGVLLLTFLAQRRLSRLWRLNTAALASGGAALLIGWTFLACLAQPATDSDWTDVQVWVNQGTPPQALLLTPARMNGFRIRGGRAIVGEWRDGTQLYFSPEFGPGWKERLQALQPGITFSPDGTQILSPGRPLGALSDEQLIALCRRFSADYIVVPPSEDRQLKRLYANASWAVYKPEIQPIELSGDDPAAEENFYRRVVLGNLDKVRKSPVRLQILDPQGRPLFGSRYRLTQLDSSVRFGCALPSFVPPFVPPVPADPANTPGPAGPQTQPAGPAPLTEDQLQLFAGLFDLALLNDGGGQATQSVDGKPDFRDLDATVAWCRQHQIRAELHYQAPLARVIPPIDLTRPFPQRVKVLAERYPSGIDYWQLSDQRSGVDQIPGILPSLRSRLPAARLGISDCPAVFSPRVGPARDADSTRGSADLRDLQTRKVGVDYIALHGHRPFGAWADARDLYAMFDHYAKLGVKVHISEFGVPLISTQPNIIGRIRQGVWTPQLQADYYERFLTICFSHPAVEAVCFAQFRDDGPIPGAGLIDPAGQPKPAFAAVQRLLTERLRTRLDGQLGLDGSVQFSVFHGSYELTLIPSDGRSTSVRFQVQPDRENSYRYNFDAAQLSLTREP